MKEIAKEQKDIEYYMQLPYSILLHQIEDEGKEYWIAEIPELPGCKSHGLTVEKAVKSVEEAKKDWILDSLEEGEDVPTPIDREKFSGKTLLRMSRSLHRALSLMAESEKLSLNQLIVTMLAKEVGKLNILNRVEQKIDSLLDRINDVVEEQRTPSLESSCIFAYQPGQYLVAGASPDIEAQAQVTFGTPAFLHGAVGTASPLEELRSCFLVRYPEGRISFGSAEQKKGEDIVETLRR
jgi:antitoxin HicB